MLVSEIHVKRIRVNQGLGVGKYEKRTLPGLELSSDLYAWTPNSSKICKQHSES